VNRRAFLRQGLAAAALTRAGSIVSASLPDAACRFTSDDPVLSRAWNQALATLARNIVTMPSYRRPVLTEGSVYHGVWLECAPQEGLVYSAWQPEIARNNHTVFFDLQRADGYLPCAVKTSGVEHSQLQIVVPIAATAWELAQQTGDEALLQQAYHAASRYDAWLMRYRNTRGTGLIEAFCTFDTGQDNSPRWKGVPNQCRDKDARLCPRVAGLPRLCPDLSATAYGSRTALAAMARALGRGAESDRWLESAQHIRELILRYLYSPDDGAFYDLDASSHFVRIRSVAIPRVLGEHVVDQRTFDHIYALQMHNPRAFWAPYPFPSIALDDPAFVRPIPRNSWGGAAQALTALRAPRWMEHYGRPADLACLMQRWIEAITRHVEFRQQMDPLTGNFTESDPGGYSPAALVFLDFLWRLHGVRAEGGLIEWNLRSPRGRSAIFTRKMTGGTAEILYRGETATLRWRGKTLATVRGTCRLVTGRQGRFLRAVGTAQENSTVSVTFPGGPKSTLHLQPNRSIPWPLAPGQQTL
jgi:hypothetical protein